MDPATEGVLTNVASSVSSVTILSASNRKGFSVFNDSAAVLYLRLGSGTASPTAHTTQVPSKGYYEGPYIYGGVVTGIWASADGAARVTEFV